MITQIGSDLVLAGIDHERGDILSAPSTCMFDELQPLAHVLEFPLAQVSPLPALNIHTTKLMIPQKLISKTVSLCSLCSLEMSTYDLLPLSLKVNMYQATAISLSRHCLLLLQITAH